MPPASRPARAWNDSAARYAAGSRARYAARRRASASASLLGGLNDSGADGGGPAVKPLPSSPLRLLGPAPTCSDANGCLTGRCAASRNTGDGAAAAAGAPGSCDPSFRSSAAPCAKRQPLPCTHEPAACQSLHSIVRNLRRSAKPSSAGPCAKRQVLPWLHLPLPIQPRHRRSLGLSASCSAAPCLKVHDVSWGHIWPLAQNRHTSDTRSGAPLPERAELGPAAGRRCACSRGDIWYGTRGVGRRCTRSRGRNVGRNRVTPLLREQSCWTVHPVKAHLAH
eukprot:135012-Chlamydomonas_euryale.AAC.2